MFVTLITQDYSLSFPVTFSELIVQIHKTFQIQFSVICFLIVERTSQFLYFKVSLDLNYQIVVPIA